MSRTKLLLKQARVSSIPKGWSISQIGKSCSIRNDLRKPISVDERSTIKGDYPYYGPTGILDYIDEYLIDGEFALIGEDGDHFLKPQDKPQTIYAKGRFNVNNHAHVIASTEACSAHWFATFFKHRNITDFLSRQGANRYKLNKATLEKLPILLPPRHEQEAIINSLSTWDEAIEKTERLAREKEKRLKWLLWELISEPKNTQKNTEWKKVKLGEVCKIASKEKLRSVNGHFLLTVKLHCLGIERNDRIAQNSPNEDAHIFSTNPVIFLLGDKIFTMADLELSHQNWMEALPQMQSLVS